MCLRVNGTVFPSWTGDVYVRARGLGWDAVVGSSSGDGFKTGAPLVLLYQSLDLKVWEFVSVLYAGVDTDGPRMECPMYAPLTDVAGGPMLLLGSAPSTAQSYYLVGVEVVNNSGVFFVPQLPQQVSARFPVAC